VVNGLAMTCKFPERRNWEGPETTTGAYGNCCKPAHTVHVVNNFNFISISIGHPLQRNLGVHVLDLTVLFSNVNSGLNTTLDNTRSNSDTRIGGKRVEPTAINTT
jgi:hypothetical protein